MFRISPVPAVGIPLSRALLCPNDDTLYDSARWRACPTCQNEDRIFLSKLLGAGPGSARYAFPFTRTKLAAASQS